jgi:hypothetical protein
MPTRKDVAAFPYLPARQIIRARQRASVLGRDAGMLRRFYTECVKAVQPFKPEASARASFADTLGQEKLAQSAQLFPFPFRSLVSA